MTETFRTWLQYQIDRFDTNAYGLSRAIGVSHVTVGKWLKGTHGASPARVRRLLSILTLRIECDNGAITSITP